jgi:hypothetical protein
MDPQGAHHGSTDAESEISRHRKRQAVAKCNSRFRQRNTQTNTNSSQDRSPADAVKRRRSFERGVPDGLHQEGHLVKFLLLLKQGLSLGRML